MVPLFHDSRKFESLILSHHSRFTCDFNQEKFNDDDALSRFTCECNKEEIIDKDDLRPLEVTCLQPRECEQLLRECEKHNSESRPDSGLGSQVEVLQTVQVVPGTLRALIDPGVGRVPREQKMLKGHLPRVVYHQVY